MSSNVYFNNSKVFSGITSYNELEDQTKPLINSVKLEGNRTAGELNLMTRDEITQLVAQARSVVVLPDYPAIPREGVLYYIGSASPYNVCLYAKNSQDVLERVDLGTTNVDISSKQDITDNNLTTTSKNIVGAINENKANIDLKQNITDDSLITENKTITTAINEIVNNKVNTLTDNVNDVTYLTTKAVNDNFAPISSVFDYGTTDWASEAGDAVFNMKSLPNGVEVQQRIYRNVVITDPVVGGNCWGRCEVVERNVRNSTVSIFQTLIVTSNVVINNQVVVQNKIFKRNGLHYGSGDTVYDNRASIDWKEWYPVEYPNIAITLNQEIVNSTSRADLAITGGIATIRFNNLNFISNVGTSALRFDNDTRLSVLRINKYATASSAGSYVWNTLISTDPTKTVLVCSNPNFFTWGATAGVGYYGLITIPLGY